MPKKKTLSNGERDNTNIPATLTRDATFRKMTNRNQTDTNEMATTETKYQTDLYSSEKNTNI